MEPGGSHVLNGSLCPTAGVSGLELGMKQGRIVRPANTLLLLAGGTSGTTNDGYFTVDADAAGAAVSFDPRR